MSQAMGQCETYESMKPRWQPTDTDIEAMARLCHEVNRAYCEIIDDPPQPRWEDAPDWQRDSIRAGVRYHLANPHASPRDSHDQWMDRKLREGWRYGATKNADTKEHPCLLPFHSLSAEQRTKDELFRGVVAVYVQQRRQDAPLFADTNEL